MNPDLFRPFAVSDYYFSKSLIFARKTLAGDEYNLYYKLFSILSNQLPIPTVYIYLHRSVSVLLENIKKRGRDYEKNITTDYLKNIQESYFDYFSQQTDFPILIFECDKLDFINNKEHLCLIEKYTFEKKHDKGVHYINI